MSKPLNDNQIEKLLPGWKKFKNDPDVVKFDHVDPAKAFAEMQRAKKLKDVNVPCPRCGKRLQLKGKTFSCPCPKE